VTANEGAIATNSASIATNSAGISTNAGNIALNSSAIAGLQTLTSTHTSQINALFGETAANRAAIDRANEGVAMALAMESPMLPGDTNFAISGGVGYFEDQGAGTMAITARIGENAAFSAGVGVGFDSGEVGARGGFQVAW
jgi:pyruvate/2-oxoacid:ferredoxin oxidoreductase beta subunit